MKMILSQSKSHPEVKKGRRKLRKKHNDSKGGGRGKTLRDRDRDINKEVERERERFKG